MLAIDETGTINDRFLQLIQHFKKGNQSAFGKPVGLKSGVIAGIVGPRQGKPGFEILQRLMTAYPTINPLWLLFGRGPMLTDGTTSGPVEPLLRAPAESTELAWWLRLKSAPASGDEPEFSCWVKATAPPHPLRPQDELVFTLAGEPVFSLVEKVFYYVQENRYVALLQPLRLDTEPLYLAACAALALAGWKSKTGSETRLYTPREPGG